MAPGAAADGWLDISESARRFGHYAWGERRLFETLGGWIPTVPEPAAKVLLGSHCAHHAWHAELCAERLPMLPERASAELVVPASEALVAFFDALAASSDQASTVEKLAGVYRVVLPHTLAAYRDHLDRVDRDVDAPTARALTLIVRDEEDHIREGEALIGSLAATAELGERVATRQAHLAKLLARAGGIAGSGARGEADRPAGREANQPT
ncbi:MAG TPA: hypothetical protein VG478_01795 [Acidimicrobiales bacterium]|jgi:hypothetical protein|nr:hypothetical protein [Acidimicrobiales bacterium]